MQEDLRNQKPEQAAPLGGNFRIDEHVRVEGESRVVDEERRMEGADNLPPLNVDVTGTEGHVCSDSYYNEERGENMVPLRIAGRDGERSPRGAIISVPESRLRPAQSGKIRSLWSRAFSRGWDRIFGKGKDKS
jgi:hypothetical protein